MAGFIAEMPVTQPNLFFAAVQFLTGPENMPTTGSALRALVKQRGAEVGEVMRSRRTQTNEVGRCAGLCLLLDRFHYQFGSTRLGEASAPVHLRCAVAGPVPVPRAVPHVVWRRGLDARPGQPSPRQRRRFGG